MIYHILFVDQPAVWMTIGIVAGIGFLCGIGLYIFEAIKEHGKPKNRRS